MKGQEDKGQDQWLLDGSLVLLAVYNGLFLLDVIFEGAGMGRWAAARSAETVPYCWDVLDSGLGAGRVARG